MVATHPAEEHSVRPHVVGATPVHRRYRVRKEAPAWMVGTGVAQDRNTGSPPEGAYARGWQRRLLVIDGLQSRGAIDVDGRGDALGPLRADPVVEEHVGVAPARLEYFC